MYTGTGLACTICSSDPVFWAISAAVLAAKVASSELSVASKIFVGKILMCAPFLTPLLFIYRGGPGCTPALSLLLGSFLDLDYLLRYEPVSLPVDRFRRFFVWGFGKAEDLARLLVVPVPVILHPVFVLYFKVLLVGLGHRLCGQPFHAFVVVHKEWHSTDSPFSRFPSGLASSSTTPTIFPTGMLA